MTINEFIDTHLTPHPFIVSEIAPNLSKLFSGGQFWTHTGTSRSIPEVSLRRLCKGYEWETAVTVTQQSMADAVLDAGYTMEWVGSDTAVYALWTRKPASILLEIIAP